MVEEHPHGYTHYVILPHLLEEGEKAAELLDNLPQHKLILLDKCIEGLKGNYSGVYQNFEKDLVGALTKALPLLRKYTSLNILFPAFTYHPKAILKGFYRFCSEYGFEAKQIHQIEKAVIHPAHAYICIMEEDLVTLIKKIKESSLRNGQQVGIISYNDTSLKEILLDGITVVSTDFANMGRTAAELVYSNQFKQIENPFSLIIRNSL